MKFHGMDDDSSTTRCTLVVCGGGGAPRCMPARTLSMKAMAEGKPKRWGTLKAVCRMRVRA